MPASLIYTSWNSSLILLSWFNAAPGVCERDERLQPSPKWCSALKTNIASRFRVDDFGRSFDTPKEIELQTATLDS
ncbi:hypothetical protein C8F04DRAFT_1111142 [Mycena alexandri]|uniref:Secreted protein n=1 Tax=Mycena alexandri TaxID=1745969 RepID=A0AAD6SRQ4_9AGAR|nr:hypothetical protein C8F04DRAFT_1110605 [Mycena alexandri]KAJ7031412.1 hypothetical protein C8F04DRAFT_1111142 [Mycena alexandri]